jgi:hypothetical protein
MDFLSMVKNVVKNMKMKLKREAKIVRREP